MSERKKARWTTIPAGFLSLLIKSDHALTI